MKISIGGQTQDAMKVLGIEAYPFTPEELSGKFRPLIQRYHPDKNKDDPMAKEFAQELIGAYKHLKNLAVITVVDKEQEQEARKIFEEDEDIFSIWDTCPRCKGSGKVKSVYASHPEICPDCDPIPMSDSILQAWFGWTYRRRDRSMKASGIKTLKCQYCDDGKFKQRNGRIVDCRICRGTGIWKKVDCRTCRGFGYVFKELKDLITCSKCDGLGKIKINPFNPVIRKGSILVK